MNQEKIIKYHIWFNLIVGAYSIMFSILSTIPSILRNYANMSISIPSILSYPTLALATLTIIFGAITLVYYIIKKIGFKLVALSILNVILIAMIFIQALIIIFPFYMALIFLYSLYLKFKRPVTKSPLPVQIAYK